MYANINYDDTIFIGSTHPLHSIIVGKDIARDKMECLKISLKQYIFPRGVKSRMCPPYPHACRKGD